MVQVIRRLRNARRSTVAECALLLAFWFVFYLPVWSGARHVGWDLDGFNYPLDRYLLDGLQAVHHLPSYDWFEYNGIDFSGDIQTAALYPPKLLILTALTIFGGSLSYPFYQLFSLLHILAFSLTTYYVAKQLGISSLYRVVAAICLAYTGVIQAQIEHFWFVGMLPWIPLCAYFAYRASTSKSRVALYLYVLFSTCMFLVGYPPQYLTIQVEIFAFVVLNQLFVGDADRLAGAFRAAISVIVGLIVSSLASAAMLLPFAVLARQSIADAYGRTYPIQSLVTLLAPNAYGHLTGNLSFETDPTTSYLFVGLLLEVAIACIPLAIRSTGAVRIALTTSSILIVANLILMVSSFSDFMHDHVAALALLRPQSGGMPFACAFTVFVIATICTADRLAIGRLRLVIRVGAVLGAASLFMNHPAYFNTPTESASVVERDAVNLISNGVPDPSYSLAIDQKTIGGPGDDWPRVFHLRSIGGEDPLAQKPYLDLLDAHGLHNSGRRVYFTDDVDVRWLEENGIGFVMSDDPKFKDLAIRSGFATVQPPPFTVFRLPNATPLATAACATIHSTALDWDQLIVSYSATAPCALRLTTNYSPFFTAGDNEAIAPIKGSLGMTVSNLKVGENVLRLKYSNPFAVAGYWMSALVLAILGVLLIRERSVVRRRNPTA